MKISKKEQEGEDGKNGRSFWHNCKAYPPAALSPDLDFKQLINGQSTSFATSPTRLRLMVTPFSPDGLASKATPIFASFPSFHD